MVLIILVFVFVFAAINLIASLTIQYIEKQKDILSLLAVGLTKVQIQRIFISNGVFICLAGLFFGLFLGYGVCFIQIWTGMITMGAVNEGFPVVFKLMDFIFIISMVLGLGFLFSWLTIKSLSRAL